MLNPVLLFVPLDDRPVTMDLIVDLARAAGVDVRTPDRAWLGNRDHAGDVDRIWTWLEGEVSAGGTTGLIASVEMLCVGGLVAARKSEVEFDAIAPRLNQLYEIASRVPAYVSAVIPRVPVQHTAEDAPRGQVAHRTRHLEANRHLIDAASRGVLRYLLIGQDDTAPDSPSHRERVQLEAHLKASGTGNVIITSGADELNARLFARWLNDLTGHAPGVRVLYTYPQSAEQVPLYESTPLSQTVGEHIRSAGCTVDAEADADIHLWVHNFDSRQKEARDQPEPPDRPPVDAVLKQVDRAVQREDVVALADVRFANGADRGLINRLLETPRLAGIVAYAGWNTCSNSLGTAIAQGVLVHHLRHDTIPGDDRIARRVLFGRILDDYGYQAYARPKLSQLVRDHGEDPSTLTALEGKCEQVAQALLDESIVPEIEQSFRPFQIDLRRVSFPWHRLFEAHIEFEIPRTHRASRPGITIVEYDRRWPVEFEREQARIRDALGDRAVAIEHIGSTSIPGLASKPTIDIMVGVRSIEDLDRCIEPLRQLGYEYDPDWQITLPHRRYFPKMDAAGVHSHHIHVVPYESGFWNRHVRFRDYLRTHPEKAREYGVLKRRILQTHRRGLEYTFAKTEFVRSVEALAGIEHRGGRLRARTP